MWQLTLHHKPNVPEEIDSQVEAMLISLQIQKVTGPNWSIPTELPNGKMQRVRLFSTQESAQQYADWLLTLEPKDADGTTWHDIIELKQIS